MHRMYICTYKCTPNKHGPHTYAQGESDVVLHNCESALYYMVTPELPKTVQSLHNLQNLDLHNM